MTVGRGALGVLSALPILVAEPLGAQSEPAPAASTVVVSLNPGPGSSQAANQAAYTMRSLGWQAAVPSPMAFLSGGFDLTAAVAAQHPAEQSATALAVKPLSGAVTMNEIVWTWPSAAAATMAYVRASQALGAGRGPVAREFYYPNPPMLKAWATVCKKEPQEAVCDNPWAYMGTEGGFTHFSVYAAVVRQVPREYRTWYLAQQGPYIVGLSVVPTSAPSSGYIELGWAGAFMEPPS